MTTRRIGRTDMTIEPLVLGTNTFGWTADETASHAILDAFVDQGFTAIDTADVYSRWVPGNDSESERIIGRWLKQRGGRDRVHVFTKVGHEMAPDQKGLSAAWILKAVDGSLKRLQTDYIDLYQSHWPDADVPQDETLEAYARLVKAGKVRWIGASNFKTEQLGEALEISGSEGLPRYETLQNEFNLLTRTDYEGGLRELVLREGLGLIPYYSLAAGFLTGKYRSKADLDKSPRGAGLEKYLDARGLAVLGALDTVAAVTGTTQAEVALAWVSAQPGVIGPLASATSVAQLASLARGARLALTPEHLALLTRAGS